MSPKTLEVKQQEAEERKAAHGARSPQEQLALLEHRRGDSTEERYRLLAEIEKGTALLAADIEKVGNGR